jgi:hypothetical protein
LSSVLLKKVRSWRQLEAAWLVIKENARTTKPAAAQSAVELDLWLLQDVRAGCPCVGTMGVDVDISGYRHLASMIGASVD